MRAKSGGSRRLEVFLKIVKKGEADTAGMIFISDTEENIAVFRRNVVENRTAGRE